MNYTPRTIRRAAQILGYNIDDGVGTRDFSVIDGTIYTDLFTGDVTIANYAGTITKAFNGKTSGTDYYNEIILDCSSRHLDTVSLDLAWGSDDLICEIKDLLDYLQADTFDIDDAGISSKKIEDFSISLKDSEATTDDKSRIINENFSFYIRLPLIVSVSRENRHDERYF